MREINDIIIHHSATEDGKTVSWSAIRRYHTSYRYNGAIINEASAKEYIHEGAKVELPWANIGYHYGIELVNDEVEIFVGRVLTDVGAHTVGHNANSIGICVVGNFDLQPPSYIKLIKAAQLTASLLTQFPKAKVHAHRDYSEKTCPGLLFDMDALLDEVEKLR